MPSSSAHLRQRLSTLLIVLTISLLSPMLHAQSSTGTLLGEVQDAKGARIRSASVAVSTPDTSLQRQTMTNSRGEFRFEGLLPGKYHIVVKASGFADASSDVSVYISSAQDTLVTLRPAPVQQTVNVTGEPSSITTEPLNTTSAVMGGVVTNTDIENIPLAARSFANIAYLVPGTEPVEPSDPTKARITAVSFGGSSGLTTR